MPPVMIDVCNAVDTRDVVHRAVQALVEGKLVGFPTETVYGVAAYALHETAVARLQQLRGAAAGPLELAVKSAEEALDYVPAASPLGQRLARRCWPGPVTLVLDDNSPDSLLKQLPPAVQEVLSQAGQVCLRAPAHELFLEVLQLLPGPVAFWPAATADGETEALTANELVSMVQGEVQVVLDDGRSRYGQSSSLVRVGADRFEVLRIGVVPEQTIRRLASVMVLFVCTGNTCRSPMAEAIFRKLVADRLQCGVGELQDRGVVVASAGIAAMSGGRPSAEAVTVVGAMGMDLSDHESQPLTPHLVRQADHIFVMTRSHRQAIVNQWPEVAERTRLICRDLADVPDPIGGPAEQYAQCAQKLAAELEHWVDELGFTSSD